MKTPSKIKLGFVPACRGVFSLELATKMRDQAVEVMAARGIEVVAPSPAQTNGGCVGSRTDAELCAKLFRDQQVHGIVIGAVNFGD
jgi:L-fucose isomerase-like protein